MEQKTTRINIATANHINSHYKYLADGTNRLLSIMLKSVTITEQKLKNLLTKQELTVIADSFNGTIIDPDQPFFRKEVLIGQIEDSETYEDISTRFNIDLTKLIDKLKLLTDTEAMILMEYIYKFWNEKNTTSSKVNFKFFD